MTMRKTWTVALLLLGSFLLTPTAITYADDQPLESAYAAILRGDYDAGRSAVDRILEQNHDAPAARRAHEWLKSYHDVIASRKDLKTKTFDWNVKEAQQALSKGHDVSGP